MQFFSIPQDSHGGLSTYKTIYDPFNPTLFILLNNFKKEKDI